MSAPRTIVRISLLAVVATVAGSTIASAQDHGKAHSIPQAAKSEPVRGTGVINKLDGQNGSVNLTHEPIPALGWPSMTMDLKVAPTVNLSTFKAGQAVDFALVRGADGIFLIESIKPKK